MKVASDDWTLILASAINNKIIQVTAQSTGAASSCVQCPQGTYLFGIASKNNTCVVQTIVSAPVTFNCTAGHYCMILQNPYRGVCVDCPAGTYTQTGDQDTCQQCV